MKNTMVLAVGVIGVALAGLALHTLPRAQAQELTRERWCSRIGALHRAYDITNNIVPLVWEGWITTGTETNVLRHDPNGFPIWQTILIDRRDEYVRHTNATVREYVHRETREPFALHAREGRIDPRTTITLWCEGD